MRRTALLALALIALAGAAPFGAQQAASTTAPAVHVYLSPT